MAWLPPVFFMGVGGRVAPSSYRPCSALSLATPPLQPLGSCWQCGLPPPCLAMNLMLRDLDTALVAFATRTGLSAPMGDRGLSGLAGFITVWQRAPGLLIVALIWFSIEGNRNQGGMGEVRHAARAKRSSIAVEGVPW